MEKRNKVPVQTFGGNLRLAVPFRLAGLYVHSLFCLILLRMNPVEKPTICSLFRGRSNMNMSVDYLLKRPHLFFYGETAISQNGSFGNANELSVTLFLYVSFLASCRYFDKRYQSFYGNVSSQSGGVQNEEGLYLGLQVVPLAHWKVTLFADLSVFRGNAMAWIRLPLGKNIAYRLTILKERFFPSYLRFSYSEKEKNGEGAQVSHSIVPYKRNKVRWQMAYQPFFWFSERLRQMGFCVEVKERKSSQAGWFRKILIWHR